MAFSIKFSEEKNELLKAKREVSFQEIILALENGHVLADIANPSQKYPHQRMYIVRINEYAYAVPYVINNDKHEIFLKTAFRSRVLTKHYLQGGKK